eukprot:TRINITY_DN41115_c0_g1_i1.p1 TRINITY_DN41115_c0_g1~~TRINITY_DN41115_c0_g1_i1.p1  ORF type:complete len:305 (+),score=66.38 TRINITY_DN41115_c0_g1_i1:57-917(+)
MPPRRPGGKYKGLVGRTKSEAQLAKEAEERQQKQSQAALKKMLNRRNQDNGSALKEEPQEDPEEIRKKKVLNMMMSGKKGGLRKFFHGWVVGVQMVLKEKKINDRQAAWQRSCGHYEASLPGGCSACKRLMAKDFDMPFSLLLKTGKTFTGGLLEATLARTQMIEAMAAGVSAMSRPQSVGALKDLRSRSKEEDSDPTLSFVEDQAPRPPWLQSRAQLVSHYKDGRKIFLDPVNMRICSEFSKSAPDSHKSFTKDTRLPTSSIASFSKTVGSERMSKVVAWPEVGE